MADLFISHSHQDVLAARDLRALLEAARYTCWMAPDDVTGAVPWAEQILDAIDASKVMIVLLSKAANDSNHVSKEVGLALERDKALLPVRVEDVMPTGSLQYLLQLVQWVDAFPGPMKDHLAQVRRQVAAVVPAPAEVSTAPLAATPAASVPGAAPGAPEALAAAASTTAASVAEPTAAAAHGAGPVTSSTPGMHGQSELVPQPPHSTWSPMSAPPPAASSPQVPPAAYGAGAPPAAPTVGGGPGGPARPWLGGSSNQRTVLASVAIIAVAVVVAAVVLGGGKGPAPAPLPTATTVAVGTPSLVPTPTLAPTPTASPSPTSSPTEASVTPSPSTHPPSSGFPNAAEADLLNHVPEAIRTTCRVADASDHLRATAEAVVDCYPHTANAPNFVRYASFPTLQAMDGIFNLDVGVAGDRASNGKSCSAAPYTGGLGTYNRNGTTVGQILCYPDGATAWMEWTYEPNLILVGANRGDGDAKSLYDWWSNLDAAGPL